MRLILNRKDFLKALQLGGSFAGKSKTIPIQDYVKIDVKEKNIYITSTDGENEICAKSDFVSSDEIGSFCLMYSSFVSYIRLIPSVEFEITIENKDCTIKHSKGKFSMFVESSENFPAMKSDDESVNVTVDKSHFSSFIFKAKDFVANDELRPVMNGIYMFVKEGVFGCAASDSHILYTDSEDYNDPSMDIDFIMNQRAFLPIMNICETSTNDISLKVSERNVICRGDICRITFRRISGTYPRFASVIPKEHKIQSIISKSEFTNSLSRVKLSANRATQLIKLQFTPLSLDICASDIDFSMDCVENIISETNGEMKIGVKADNIEKCLKATDSDSVRFLMTDETRAIVIKNVNDDKKTILIMPMMLNN